MQRLLKTYLTVLCALCATGTLEAVPQLPLPVAPIQTQEQEDSVRVSLVTFYPGSEPHNIWGHSEIRVQQGPIDLYFNYGVFDFQAPAFMWRFMLGETDYMCQPVPRAYATLKIVEVPVRAEEFDIPSKHIL